METWQVFLCQLPDTANTGLICAGGWFKEIHLSLEILELTFFLPLLLFYHLQHFLFCNKWLTFLFCVFKDNSQWKGLFPVALFYCVCSDSAL